MLVTPSNHRKNAVSKEYIVTVYRSRRGDSSFGVALWKVSTHRILELKIYGEKHGSTAV